MAGAPAVTAAAIACAFSAGEYKSATWSRSGSSSASGQTSPSARAALGHDEYTHYYYAQVDLRPRRRPLRRDVPRRKTERALADLEQVQGGHVRPICIDAARTRRQLDGAATSARSSSTSMYLTILQLDKGDPADLPAVNACPRGRQGGSQTTRLAVRFSLDANGDPPRPHPPHSRSSNRKLDPNPPLSERHDEQSDPGPDRPRSDAQAARPPSTASSSSSAASSSARTRSSRSC